jgi:hypothetical protein
LTEESVSNLKEAFWLTTDLIDYLIKHAIDRSEQREIIIPTSAIESLIKSLVLKSSKDQDFFYKKQLAYQQYCKERHKIVMSTCTHGHYFVISLTIDGSEGNTGQVFKDDKIYDSLKRVHERTILTFNPFSRTQSKEVSCN